MLQWIRKARTKKRFRTITIIGIVVLSFGLIGSYAWWSIPKASPSRANDSSAVDPSIKYENLEKRVAEIEKSLSESQENSELLEKLANAYYDLGYQMVVDGIEADTGLEKLNLALENYEKVLDLTPDSIPVTLQAAYTAFIVGNIDKADAFYKDALRLDPKSTEVKSFYGQFLLFGMNDFDGARKQWQEALSLGPDDETKKNLEALIEQANQMEEYQKIEAKGSEQEKPAE